MLLKRLPFKVINRNAEPETLLSLSGMFGLVSMLCVLGNVNALWCNITDIAIVLKKKCFNHVKLYMGDLYWMVSYGTALVGAA